MNEKSKSGREIQSDPTRLETQNIRRNAVEKYWWENCQKGKRFYQFMQELHGK